MKRNDLLTLWNVLNELNSVTSVKISYFIAKNKLILKPEIDAINETQNSMSKDFKEFERRRMLLVQQFGLKENGRLKVDDNGMVTIDSENREKFNVEFAKLINEYKDVISNEEERKKDFEKFLDEEIDDFETKLFKINDDEILSKDDIINANQLFIFMSYNMIVENDKNF